MVEEVLRGVWLTYCDIPMLGPLVVLGTFVGHGSLVILGAKWPTLWHWV